MSSLLVRRARRVPVRSAIEPNEPLLDVRITGGVVSEIGPSLANTGEAELDAGGRWVIPGLWDQHVHLSQWALSSHRLDLSPAGSADEAAALVAAAIARPGDGPIIGYGHRSAIWVRQPTVAELDAVSGPRPVVLISGDAHNGWLNSAALRLFRVPHRDSALAENEWFEVLSRLHELPGQAVADPVAIRTALEAAAAKGIVGVRDFEFEPGFSAWPPRAEAGADLVRVRAATYPDDLDKALAAGLRTGQSLGGLVTMGPLKLIFDGSLNTRTACCASPYIDGAGELSSGQMNYTPQQLVELVARAKRGGLEVAVHAIGDLAVSTALDAIELVGVRGSIEHAQLMAWSDVSRMSRLGVVASVQPAHLLDDRDVADVCWSDRTERCFPLAAMRAAGVRLAMGSDAPVAPLDPWLAMAAAVHRSGDERPAWHGEQSLSVGAALAASTDEQPTIEAGSRGDLVLLDADPLENLPTSAATAAHLRAMPVAATIVAGRLVHSASGIT